MLPESLSQYWFEQKVSKFRKPQKTHIKALLKIQNIYNQTLSKSKNFYIKVQRERAKTGLKLVFCQIFKTSQKGQVGKRKFWLQSCVKSSQICTKSTNITTLLLTLFSDDEILWVLRRESQPTHSESSFLSHRPKCSWKPDARRFQEIECKTLRTQIEVSNEKHSEGQDGKTPGSKIKHYLKLHFSNSV